MRPTAESIVAEIKASFPDTNARPSPEQLEKVMRPLAPQSYLFRRRIRDLMGFEPIAYEVDHWMEANQIVLGRGIQSRIAREFALSDPCTCFTVHLDTAIKHARKNVDNRLIDLLPNGNHC